MNSMEINSVTMDLLNIEKKLGMAVPSFFYAVVCDKMKHKFGSE